MTSPFSLHQQQLAMLAQQQFILMSVATKSGAVGVGDIKFAGTSHQAVPNGNSSPAVNWPNGSFQPPFQNNLQVDSI